MRRQMWRSPQYVRALPWSVTNSAGLSVGGRCRKYVRTWAILGVDLALHDLAAFGRDFDFPGNPVERRQRHRANRVEAKRRRQVNLDDRPITNVLERRQVEANADRG